MDEDRESIKERVAVVGCGNMGRAMLDAFLQSGEVDEGRSVVLEKDPLRRELLADLLPCIITDAPEQVKGCSTVFLSIKPQDLKETASALAPHLTPSAVVVSCLAGIPLALLREELGNHTRIIRCMPNLPVQIGRGVTGYVATEEVSEEVCLDFERLLAPSGVVVRFQEEESLDIVTAVSGSGPGYVAYFMEEMVTGAIRLGLSQHDALLLVTETFLGAAELLRHDGRTPEELREAVTSKGGTTAAALAVMRERGVGSAITDALAAAHRRAKELSRG